MLRVGLTGGLASGKTFVGRALAEMGCFLIQADELGHQVMAKDAEAYRPILAEFGETILDENSSIDRRKLAALVFNNPDLLHKLNAIVHPAVRVRGKLLAEAFAQREPHGICVYEAAILVETGSFREYDRLIVASCSEQQQVERAVLRDHLTRDEVLSRLRRQMPLEEKVKYADYVIDTSQTKEHTLDQTRTVYASLRSLQHP
ncbi:MAG: dephospho-CoA kinase [Bryobacteraceae bacterium]|jgi:dephospho-CoA kinase